MSGLPLRKPRDLVSAGLASPEEVEALQAVTDRYPMAVAPGMVAAMADEGVRRVAARMVEEAGVTLVEGATEGVDLVLASARAPVTVPAGGPSWLFVRGAA